MAISIQFQRDSAYERLLEHLFAGRLPVGQPLSERQIAAELNMSRTPVREAIQALAKDGLLEVIPARGTFVASISDDQLRELYEVRYGLEGHAAELAARAGASRELLAYRNRLERSRAADTDAKLDSTYETGADFHVEVFRCAGNSILLDLYLPIRNRFRATMRLACFYDKQWVVDGIDQHLGILAAIEQRDSALARRRMVRHLKNSYASKRRILDAMRRDAASGT